MSIFGMMGTAITGLNAQANKLSTISDNISNSNTTGYKNADEAFETILGVQTPGFYSSGGVQSLTTYSVTSQGTLTGSSQVTNLGIQGNGFFVVNSSPDGTGTTALTRAGDFVPDKNGNLVNTAGYYLMGYSVDGTTSGTLTVVNTGSQALKYQASTQATYAANLPSTAGVVTGDTAGANAADSTYSNKASIIAYDNLGTPVKLDIYTTKTAANTWEVSVYNAADAAPGGGFPYTPAANANPAYTEPLNTTTLNFDPNNGKLALGSPTSLTLAVPNGDQSLKLDMSGMTQLASNYSPTANSADGFAPTAVSSVSIANDGTLSYNYANGIQVTRYKIPLANVASPDNLRSESGNVYLESEASGQILIGSAGSGSLGAIDSGELESSTVDIATELSNMIQAQQAYQANSKVLQTASDLLSVINNIK